jgi:putative ABC transport system permease protein
MLKNYLKTAWRNLVFNKVYSALNILGLAVGMGVALLIGLWVYTQYSYDRFLPGYRQAYQVRQNAKINGSIQTFIPLSLTLADALRAEVPEIRNVTETDWNASHGLMVGSKKLYRPGTIAASNFLQVFPFPLWRGDPSIVLRNPYSIVITRSLARSLFGKEDAVNETVRLDNEQNLTVTGILDDLPANSSFQFEYLIPFSFLEATKPFVKQQRAAGWYANSYQLYVQLQPGATWAQTMARAKDLPGRHDKTVNYSLTFQPLKNWHLYGTYENGVETGGFIQYVRLFTIIGLLILTIACINFVNLSTARSEKRAREVGVRKAIGGLRGQIIGQFLVESLVLTAIALFFSVLFTQLALPYFNALTNSSIAIPYAQPLFWCILTGLLFLTGLLAGSRPAFYLSSFRTVNILKGKRMSGKGPALARKILVVTQFSCSIALIASTFIVYQQLQYARNRDTGYNVNRLLQSALNPPLSKNYNALKNELLGSGVVSAVTRSSGPATGIYWHTDLSGWPGKRPDEQILFGAIGVSKDYFRTLGMKLVAGTGFTGVDGADTLGVVFNETAIGKMRLKDPLNQVVYFSGQPLRVVGVVKDAWMDNPFSSADPVMFLSDAKWATSAAILYRLSPSVGIHEAITRLETIFDKYNPAYSYDYQFADDAYADKFRLETLLGRLAAIFAGLAVLISCLGLFGLAAYTAEQRTKEIGVRKVLGASVLSIWKLLSTEFMLLVGLSCVIATPVAYYFLQHWLRDYHYHITIGGAPFILSALVAVTITIMTVSVQAIKAGLANPIDSLRTE